MQRCKTIFVALDKPRGSVFVCVMVNHIIYGPRRKKALSSGVCEQQKLSLISAFVIRLLETRNIHFFLLTTIVIASPGLHVIFNIESGQNVNRPVTTLGNISDDAALLRRIDANISSFDNM